MVLATIPSLVSTHSTPSQAGVSCRARWRKLRRPALISSAAPISRSQVLVVSTDPFTAYLDELSNSPDLGDPVSLGKECSHWTFYIYMFRLHEKSLQRRKEHTECREATQTHCGIYPTFREFSENLEVRTFGVKEQISGSEEY